MRTNFISFAKRFIFFCRKFELYGIRVEDWRPRQNKNNKVWNENIWIYDKWFYYVSLMDIINIDPQSLLLYRAWQLCVTKFYFIIHQPDIDFGFEITLTFPLFRFAHNNWVINGIRTAFAVHWFERTTNRKTKKKKKEYTKHDIFVWMTDESEWCEAAAAAKKKCFYRFHRFHVVICSSNLTGWKPSKWNDLLVECKQHFDSVLYFDAKLDLNNSPHSGFAFSHRSGNCDGCMARARLRFDINSQTKMANKRNCRISTRCQINQLFTLSGV